MNDYERKVVIEEIKALAIQQWVKQGIDISTKEKRQALTDEQKNILLDQLLTTGIQYGL